MAFVINSLLVVAVCATAVLAAKEHHRGILKATTSTGNALQQHTKHVGSPEPTTTKTISADLQQLGREGVRSQLNRQKLAINDSHTAQLTETGLLIRNSSGDVEQSIDLLNCSPLELAEVQGGIDGGSSRKVIILLIMCRTNGQVLYLIDFDGRYIVQPYETVNTQFNAVAVTMSTDSTPTATGLAFLDGNTLLHRPYLVSSYPKIFDVTVSPLNCQQPSLVSLNSTHYLLLCASIWYTVDGDGKTALIGSREPGSVISSSSHGKVVVSSTDTQANVLTHHLTQSCPLEVDGLERVDFMDVDNTTLVLMMTSKGVYKQDISSGCPSSTPSLVTMVTPVCLIRQECYGYYFSEDSRLLFITSTRSSNPNRYEVEAYDIVTNTSLEINFVLSQPPLLLYYQPLPPAPPSPSPSPVGTITTTALNSSPFQTPPSSNDIVQSGYIAVIALAGLVLILFIVMVLLGVMCFVMRNRRKRILQARDNGSYVMTEKSSVESDETPRAPVQEISTRFGGPEEETTPFRYSLPATTVCYQQSSRSERGPNEPSVYVATS